MPPFSLRPDNKSIGIQVLEDCFEYKWITQMPVFLSATAYSAAGLKVLVFIMTHLCPRDIARVTKMKKKCGEKQHVRLFLISTSPNRRKKRN